MSQRRRERRLGPDWTQLGIGVMALLASSERIIHPLCVARASGWSEKFQPLIPPSAAMSTPSESLSGGSLLLSVTLFLIGLALLRIAFGTRRSPW